MKTRIRYFARPYPRLEISNQTGTPKTVQHPAVEVPVFSIPTLEDAPAIVPYVAMLPPGRYTLEVLVEAVEEPEAEPT